MRNIFILLFILSALNCFAKKTDVNQARIVAKNYIRQFKVIEEFTIDSVSSGNKTTIYIFNASNNEGFVLVSANDCAVPILGYSTKSNFSLNQAPSNIKKWVEGYVNEIRQLKENEIATDSVKLLWNKLIDNTFWADQSRMRVNNVAPLIQTQWNQNPYYNELCPIDTRNNEQTVVGCAATAMAQVMKYWNYPERGSGFKSYNHPRYGTLSANFAATTYNWQGMPNTISSSNLAVALLSYHCGISMEMQYGIGSEGGSLAFAISESAPNGSCTEQALKQYFNYDQNLRGIKKVRYSDFAWMELIRNELNSNRPILYAGFGNGGGHAFICDGYSANNFFHFNWGWGGLSDGNFQLTALGPNSLGTGGGNGAYNNGQQMITGVQPPPANQRYNLRLANTFTIAPSQISRSGNFSVSANISNNGVNSFNGDFTIGVYRGNNYIDTFGTISNVTLPPNYQFTNNLIFSSTGIPAMWQGNYSVYLLYRPTGGNWQIVSNNGSLINGGTISVVSNSPLTMFSPFRLTSAVPIITRQSFSGTVNVLNRSNAPFTGDIDIDIYRLNGTYVQTLQSYPVTDLCVNCRFVNDLTFLIGDLNLLPGSYNLVLSYRVTGGQWNEVNNGQFSNPVTFTVVAPTLIPDVYEPNNTALTANTADLTWRNDTTRIATNQSNLHVGNDLDHYRINLPAGYDYTLNPRLNDAYNSNNGNTYTVDALFSYSSDNGNTSSETFDDVMPQPIVVRGPATLVFKIAPYFSGSTGSYQFDLPISRRLITATDEITISKDIQIYPNPAFSLINIKLPTNAKSDNSEYFIQSLEGKTIGTGLLTEELTSINVSTYPKGLYLIKVITNKNQSVFKVAIN
jgi:hypothetical protein